ncbi:hypothetical protein EBR66_04335 [bacterium]|nr:hypothetical protein [bacterium]
MHLYTIIAAIVIMFVSLSGVFFTRGLLGVWMKKNITFLTSFATGVFAVLGFHLISESIENSHGIEWTIAALIFGVVCMEILHWALPSHRECVSHDHSLDGEHSHTPIDGRRILVSDAIHNVGDGFVLVPAYAAGVHVGITATIGIVLHELVQETSKFFLLKEAGYSDWGALIWNFISASSVVFGAIAAMILSSNEFIAGILSAIAAGAFSAVLVRDLIPHVLSALRSDARKQLHAIALVGGLILMISVVSLTPHNHAVESAHEEVVN